VTVTGLPAAPNARGRSEEKKDVKAMLEIEGRLSLELRRLTRADNESISAEIPIRRISESTT
jgi:hypothetical protein